MAGAGLVLKHQYRRALILGVILLALWLRIWKINLIPPGLWFDEALNGMEAVWMFETGQWPIFILNGQGREVLFHYLLAISICLFSTSVFAVRLVSVLLGVLSIALMFKWAITLYQDQKEKGYWIALISSTGLAVSFWYLVMGRVGYRANVMVSLLLLTCYFFWRAWQTGKLTYYVLAGVALGGLQYTYLAARLTPAIFIGFVVIFTVLHWSGKSNVKRTWLGLGVMLATALVVYIPMALFFTQRPELFWARGGDVSLKVDGVNGMMLHLVTALRVFIDGQDPNWRHHLLGQPVMSWFSTIGFLIGIIVSVKNFRRPVYLFIYLMLIITWLPAPLSERGFSYLAIIRNVAGVLSVFCGWACWLWSGLLCADSYGTRKQC